MRYPKTRLSLLMFIQFFIWGATGPVLSLYLRECLHFSGAQVGLVLGLAAVSSIVSPVIMTFLADRVISSERLLCLLNVVGGVFMYLFSLQTEFYPALLMYVLNNIAMNPTVPLINAISFHHSPGEREKFGNIRVWGTFGWIAVAWFFSFIILKDGGGAARGAGESPLPILLRIASVTAFVMAAYSLTIPKGSGRRPPDSKREFFPVDAFRVILKPQVLALAFVGAAGTFIDRFYNVGASLYLKQIGFAEGDILPAMSLGQVPEIFAMGALALLLRRFGARVVLLSGICLGIFRFAVFAFGTETWLIYTALSVHGLVYTFIMITIVICLDRHCGAADRTGAHQLFAVVTAGFGGFFGNYAAGLVIDFFADSAGVVEYSAYWTVPLVVSVIIFVTILFVKPSNHNV